MCIAFSAETAELPKARVRPRDESAAVAPSIAAWLAVVPTAALVVAAIALLGRPLGSLLFPAPDAVFWPSIRYAVRPEPTEQAGYLIALTAPLVLAGLTLLLVHRAPGRIAVRAPALAACAELAVLLFVVACFVAQRLQAPQNYEGRRRPVVYFTLPALLFAAALAAALVLAARSPAVRGRVARLARESRARRVAVAFIALLALAVTLLPAIHTDRSIAATNQAVAYHLYFTYDETIAVVDGRSPLGDFAAQYSSLWPYAFAAAMTVVGSSLTAFTGLLAALTSAMLLGLYDVLRRLTRSALIALLLFLPLLATFGLRLHGPHVDRFSLMNYFGVVPLRYAGPLLLAWLLARHLDGARPRRLWPLFLAGGLVAINNLDFGLAAVAATVAALVWTRPRRAASRRAAVEAAAGAAGAVALVTALVLVRTGAAPHPELLVHYAHVFAVDGFSMIPIRPLVGVDLVVFLTYVAAVGVATARALRRDADRLLTGLLVWSGIFGLGAGSYYVGHSISELLMYMLPAWAFTVTLLAVAALRAIAATDRLPRPSHVLCLFGLGLVVCSLAQTPLPWQQLDRIATSESAMPFAHPTGEAFVAQHVAPGEPVLILGFLGHRIAANLGIDDVDPVTGGRSIFTLEQLVEAIGRLRRAGGEKIFVQDPIPYQGLPETLATHYQQSAAEPEGMQLWQPR
jgi:hypothetical protein